MNFILIFTLCLVIASAEILEPAVQVVDSSSSSVPVEGLLDDRFTPETLDEQPSPPLLSTPTELQDKRARQQRNVLIKTEIPTLVVPTYEIPQFYILVDQPRYAPWYYYPALPAKEKPEKQEKE